MTIEQFISPGIVYISFASTGKILNSPVEKSISFGWGKFNKGLKVEHKTISAN